MKVCKTIKNIVRIIKSAVVRNPAYVERLKLPQTTMHPEGCLAKKYFCTLTDSFSKYSEECDRRKRQGGYKN